MERVCHRVLPTLPITKLTLNTRRTAQRVKAAQRPKGGAVTQRRETDARCLCIGKQLADLPSGERIKKKVLGLHVLYQW